MFPLTPKEFGPIPQSAPHYAAASALYGNHPINPFRGWRVTAGVAAPLSGKAQSLCCNRRQGEVSFPWGGAYACCSDQRKRSIFRGRSEFRGTQFGAKKKKKVKKKKRQRKAQELKSKARGSRCNRPLTLVRAHRFSVEPAVTPETPCPERAGPQAQRPSGAWGPPGSRPPLGRGSPWHCRRRCRAISKRESSSAAPLGGRPGGEGPAFSRRRPLAASPGLRAMPPAV